MAEAVKGSRLVYLFRIKDASPKPAGKLIAYTTDNNLSISKNAEVTATKDGSMRTPGSAEISLSVTCMLKKGDSMVEDLKKAMLDDKLIEIWEANLDEPGTGSNKFKGTYYQGYITSYAKSSSADGYVSISLDFGINGKGADGDVTVSVEQQEEAAYVFTDTVAGS